MTQLDLLDRRGQKLRFHYPLDRLDRLDPQGLERPQDPQGLERPQDLERPLDLAVQWVR